MMIFAYAYLLGAASVFVAQYVYVRRQAARERASLIDLHERRSEVPGAIVIEVFRKVRANENPN